jgi:glucokinase
LGLGIAEFVRDGELTSAEVFAWRVQPRDLLADAAGGGVVAVEADVRCAATAEAAVRRTGDSDPMLYVSWGTGLSCTLVVAGRCLAGNRGEALALGAWPVDARVDPAWVGNLEGYASGLGIAARYAAHTSRVVPGAEVARRAGDDDVDARFVVESAAEAVARAVAALVLVVDPAVVVLGGGVGMGTGPLSERVQQSVPGMLARPAAPPVEQARAGADAGMVGAGLVAWRALEP